MGSYTYTVTDEYGEGRADRVAGSDVADMVRPWFPQAPADVLRSIDRFGDALARGSRDSRADLAEAKGLAEYLGLRVEVHDE